MNEDIKTFRKKSGISISELAKKIGISRMTLYRWENSKHKPHSNHYEKLKKLMDGCK